MKARGGTTVSKKSERRKKRNFILSLSGGTLFVGLSVGLLILMFYVDTHPSTLFGVIVLALCGSAMIVSAFQDIKPKPKKKQTKQQKRNAQKVQGYLDNITDYRR